MRRKGGKGPSGTVCGVGVCGSPGLGSGRVIQKHFCLPDTLWTLVEGTTAVPVSWGSIGLAPGPGQSQSLQQIPGQVEAARGQQREQRIWGLYFPSLTQTLNKVKARCGPIHLPDPEGKSHLCNKALKKPPGPGARSHCAMFSCNLSRLKTHLTKCKEGSALISSGKGQKWHEWLGALLGILRRRCLVLRFFKDFEAGNIRHEALGSWEFYLPEDIQLSFSCNFWIHFFFSCCNQI